MIESKQSLTNSMTSLCANSCSVREFTGYPANLLSFSETESNKYTQIFVVRILMIFKVFSKTY